MERIMPNHHLQLQVEDLAFNAFCIDVSPSISSDGANHSLHSPVHHYENPFNAAVLASRTA